jgi:urease accessory protein
VGTGIPAAALLLADGRFPSGGHVHSAGVEAAVTDGRVTGEETLEAYLRGRAVTAGRTEAALAAATVVRVRAEHPSGLRCCLEILDEHATARIAPPPLREASRRQGRALHRAASRCWPSAVLSALEKARPSGAHLPVAWGAVGVAAGLDANTVARLVLHHAVTTPAQAAVRLLGLDPFGVAALSGRVLDGAEGVVADALESAAGPLEGLPAWTSPLVEIAAMAHVRADGRLFVT